MVDHGSLNPHYFWYPSLLFDVIAGIGWVQQLVGHWHPGAGLTVQNEGIARTTDPHLFIALRLVGVVLSIGTCIVIWGLCFLIARRWWAATLAGLLLAVSPLMVANSLYITPDTYSTFFTAVGLIAAIWLMRRGSRLAYVLAGTAVGLATGSGYNAVVVAVAVVAAHFLRYPQAKEPVISEGTPKPHTPRWAQQLAPLLVAGLAAIIAFVVTTPGAAIDSHQFLHDALAQSHMYTTSVIHGYNAQWPLAFYTATLNDQGLIFTTLVGIGLFGFCGRWWRESLVMAVFVVCYGWLISSQLLAFSRDLLPAMPALAVLAALGVATIVERVRHFFDHLSVAVAAGALVIAGLASPVATSARIPGELNEHPNTEAQAWISKHVPVGSTVVVEIYGPWIDVKKYHLVKAQFLLDTSAADIQANAAAIVLTELGSGRFLSDPTKFPAEASTYRRLTSTHCLGASYTDGPWVRIFVPCPKKAENFWSDSSALTGRAVGLTAGCAATWEFFGGEDDVVFEPDGPASSHAEPDLRAARYVVPQTPGDNRLEFVEKRTEKRCRLPATWDQVAASFASGMGPPPLPVMGPP